MRVLITGVAGMLGATLVDKWKNKFEVYGTDKSNFKKYCPVKFMQFDLFNNSYNALLEWAKPKVIIHCGAITNVDYCEDHPKQAMAVNSESVNKILESALDARLIFISSEAVFPDGLLNAKEQDNTGPENSYGRSKLAGEKFIQDAGKMHVAVRTTIVGKNINPASKGFLEWIVESVNSGNEITLFHDAIFNPITIWHFADELEWIIRNEISEIVHVAGIEPISKYEFGVKICNQLGLDTSIIRKGSIEDIDFKAKRNKDQTLDSTYYQRLSGRILPSADNTIASIVKYFKEYAYA